MTDSAGSTSRRKFLQIASASASILTTGALIVPLAARAMPLTTSVTSDCVLMPQIIEGPYYLDPKLVRSDIREGKPGVPMHVRLRVVDATRCTPTGESMALMGARVDVWQADSRGVYSGYADQGDDSKASTLGQTYLRGTQMTDAEGWVSFDAIYPGWYAGRSPHFHIKVYVDQLTVAIGEMHFPDTLSEFIFNNVSHYGNRLADRSVININDPISRGDTDFLTYCSIKEEPNRYVASFVVGVDRRMDAIAAAAAKRGGAPAIAFASLGTNQSGPPHLAIRNRIAALVPGPNRRPAVRRNG